LLLAQSAKVFAAFRALAAGLRSPASMAVRACAIAGESWRSARSVRWKTENVLVYMIADLVGVSAGRVAEAASAALAAQFDSFRQALVAAKRIQTSILELVACRPGERIAAAILIYQPRSSDVTGFSVELVRLALENAKPGQILVADNVSQRLRDLPGIEFRVVGGLTGDEQTGLSEFVDDAGATGPAGKFGSRRGRTKEFG
jgi:class 3 adenylate cyclase